MRCRSAATTPHLGLASHPARHLLARNSIIRQAPRSLSGNSLTCGFVACRGGGVSRLLLVAPVGRGHVVDRGRGRDAWSSRWRSGSSGPAVGSLYAFLAGCGCASCRDRGVLLTCDNVRVLGFERQRGMFDVAEIAPGLVPKGGVYGFLAEHRVALFPDADFADLFPSRRGRASVPASVMATALLLQALESKTDREAAEALTFDLRWKAACGLPVDGRCFHFSAFSAWRNRLAASKRPDRVFAMVDRVISECGVLEGKRARVVDSTIVDDAVARQDATTLLAWQIKAVARTVPGWAAVIGGLPGARWHVGAGIGKPDIDWRDQAAREQLICELVEDARTITGWDQRELTDTQLDAVGLLATLAGQDVEPAQGSDGTDGRWRIAQKVAPDRVISVVDPQARHARKTRSNKRDGFKAHVVIEPVTGLGTAAQVTQAAGDGTGDGQVGATLIGQDPAVVSGDVDEVLGDGAYATETMLHACATYGVAPIIKPQPLIPAVDGGFTVDDFQVDEQAHTVACPNGQIKKIPTSGQVKFGACSTCPLQGACTKAANRTIRIDTAHLTHRAHRAFAASHPQFHQTYRTKRPMVERSLAWFTARARRVPYRGVTKNNAWWRLRVAAVNLKRLNTLGLTRHDGTWHIATS